MDPARRRRLALIAACALLAGCARGRGAALFQQLCARCHPTGGEGGGNGPGLGGVLGRRAGAGAGFGYSQQLRAAGITWDEQSLDRFLAGPGVHVPGTLMQLEVPDSGDRAALIGYLATLPAAGPR